MKQLNYALKNLKKNKASDPDGIVNEVFITNNIGDKLKEYLLFLLNSMKTNQLNPSFMEKTEITSFYKEKSPIDDLNSDRCIFKLDLIRSIRKK